MPKYLGIPRERIRVVPLGINFQGYEMREREASQPFTVGFFARVAPEKGLHLLADSYRQLRAAGKLSEARLEVAGYLAPEHQAYLRDIERQMNDAGLGHEFNYRGALNRSEKIAFLRKLDVLSVPATYDEPKGIFLLEAMACGVPVVQPDRGAFSEIINKTHGGLFVEPDDTENLASGILTIYREPELARHLSQRGFQGVREHYSVAHMADGALEVYEELVSRGSSPTNADYGVRWQA
jgi:glycosyltransferase involved in cell wall biosynthesis